MHLPPFRAARSSWLALQENPALWWMLRPVGRPDVLHLHLSRWPLAGEEPHGLSLLVPTWMTGINNHRHDPPGCQPVEGRCQRQQGRVSHRDSSFIRTRQVTEVEHKRLHFSPDFGWQRVSKRFVGCTQGDDLFIRHPCIRHSLTCPFQGGLLNIKGEDPTARRYFLGQKQGVVAVPRRPIHRHITSPKMLRNHTLRPLHG